MFTYNRFSSLDRIGDANQVSLGLATRFIDETSGYEKIYAGVGEIYYFKKREVTLCTTRMIALTLKMIQITRARFRPFLE